MQRTEGAKGAKVPECKVQVPRCQGARSVSFRLQAEDESDRGQRARSAIVPRVPRCRGCQGPGCVASAFRRKALSAESEN